MQMCLDTSIQCALHNLHVRLANNYHFAVPLQTAFNWCSVSLEATLYLASTSGQKPKSGTDAFFPCRYACLHLACIVLFLYVASTSQPRRYIFILMHLYCPVMHVCNIKCSCGVWRKKIPYGG